MVRGLRQVSQTVAGRERRFWDWQGDGGGCGWSALHRWTGKSWHATRNNRSI